MNVQLPDTDIKLDRVFLALLIPETHHVIFTYYTHFLIHHCCPKFQTLYMAEIPLGPYKIHDEENIHEVVVDSYRFAAWLLSPIRPEPEFVIDIK